jgi:hypothetical protein
MIAIINPTIYYRFISKKTLYLINDNIHDVYIVERNKKFI